MVLTTSLPLEGFKAKRHDLLGYHNNQFDRDYVEFNVKISELEGSLQAFINASFDNITSIENSLKLLNKFKKILQVTAGDDTSTVLYCVLFSHTMVPGR